MLRIVTLSLLAGLICAVPCRAQSGNVFGTAERKGATLIGIFYDLKQTQKREPVPDYARTYNATIDEFVVSGFDEAVLNRFFRAALPLYTTQFAIPYMNADGAPKAFGVHGTVDPSHWVVHYKAQIAPPADGTYRFVGGFDDVLIVAINRKVVLNGSLPQTKLPRLGWKEPADKGPPVAGNGSARYGDWIVLKAGQPVDIDILIGERPGGKFMGFLFYQKQGEVNPRSTVLPLFQLAEHRMDDRYFSTTGPVWQCFD